MQTGFMSRSKGGREAPSVWIAALNKLHRLR